MQIFMLVLYINVLLMVRLSLLKVQVQKLLKLLQQQMAQQDNGILQLKNML
jgi:hypothetical protein